MSVAQDLISLSKLRLLRLLALTALIVGVGLKGFIDKLAVLDPDMWWHLSVGQWIVQHRAFPHDGIFSQTAAARPWMAYSWGYEVLLGCLRLVQLHRDGGFRHSAHNRRGVGHLPHPLPDFRALLGSVGAVDRGVRRIPIQHRAAARVLLVDPFHDHADSAFRGATQRTGTKPVLASADFPGVGEYSYSVHLRTCRGGTICRGESPAADRAALGDSSRIPANAHASRPCAICCSGWLSPGGLCRTVHLYQEAFVISQSKIIYKIIRELQALSFEYFNQYLELLLAVGAYFAIGWKKKIDPFKFALLILATIFAFRTWRDAWFLCVVAAAIIADFPPGGENI
jgi:hypothetical protein